MRRGVQDRPAVHYKERLGR